MKKILASALLVAAFAVSAAMPAGLAYAASAAAAGNQGTSGMVQGGQDTSGMVQGGQAIATLPNPLGSKVGSLSDLFYALVNVVIGVSYTVVAFFLIVSGFKFVKAQGNEKELEDAKTTFKYTLIGAFIVVGAQTLAHIIQSVIAGLQK